MEMAMACCRALLELELGCFLTLKQLQAHNMPVVLLTHRTQSEFAQTCILWQPSTAIFAEQLKEAQVCMHEQIQTVSATCFLYDGIARPSLPKVASLGPSSEAVEPKHAIS